MSISLENSHMRGGVHPKLHAQGQPIARVRVRTMPPHLPTVSY